MESFNEHCCAGRCEYWQRTQHNPNYWISNHQALIPDSHYCVQSRQDSVSIKTSHPGLRNLLGKPLRLAWSTEGLSWGVVQELTSESSVADRRAL
jgi:hypothetical protein